MEPASDGVVADDEHRGRGLGIASICCGAVGLCVPGAALVGVVLGLVGSKKAKPGDQSLPRIGTGVSGGSLLLNTVFLVGMAAGIINSASMDQQMYGQQSQLREIGLAYTAYAVEDKQSRYPDHAVDIEPYLASGTDVFIAPPDRPGDIPLDKTEDRPTKPYVYGSFEFMPLGGVTLEMASHRLLIACSAKPCGPDEDLFICVFMDGHTERLDREALEKARAETLQAIHDF